MVNKRLSNIINIHRLKVVNDVSDSPIHHSQCSKCTDRAVHYSVYKSLSHQLIHNAKQLPLQLWHNNWRHSL